MRRDDDTSLIGVRVKWWRLERRQSQQAVADKAGLSKGYLSKIENGIAQLDRRTTVESIADFSCSSEWPPVCLAGFWPRNCCRSRLPAGSSGNHPNQNDKGEGKSNGKVVALPPVIGRACHMQQALPQASSVASCPM